MARPRIAVDGVAGTTGLRIRELLEPRSDLEVRFLDDERRKDPAARRELLNEVDLALLCLPDQAAREAVAWIESTTTRVLDASTAHRVDPAWVFGLPELQADQRAAIREARRVSNPGCYSTAVILALRPLIDTGLLPADAPVVVHALSGYSGGGRKLIERWEDPERGLLMLPFEAPYALERVHKHMPEIQHYTGLDRAPQFVPAKGPFRDGMRVQIPLHAALLAGGADAKALWEALARRYQDEPFIELRPYQEPVDFDDLTLDPRALNGTNRLEITVVPNPAGHVLLVVRLDNLGKGAAGAAVQNLNLMLGLSETAGLAG